MPKIAYIEKSFQKKRLDLIAKSNSIIAEYSRQGFTLTLRQLYYQLVSRDLIPNSQTEYKKLSATISDARLAGLVDWNAIIDRTRNLRANSHWVKPADILESAIASYRIDKWADQPYRPEVWIEKDALIGVIEGVCKRLDVPYFAARGYNSQSEMWAAGRYRFGAHRRLGQVPIIFHLGDHDPSGLDMTRDIVDRLALFAGQDIEVRRLALNFDQVEQYAPPPNFAKVSDPRAEGYMAEFGRSSWELDALSPAVIADLITVAIESIRDENLWQAAMDREEKEIQDLRDLIEQL